MREEKGLAAVVGLLFGGDGGALEVVGGKRVGVAED